MKKVYFSLLLFFSVIFVGQAQTPTYTLNEDVGWDLNGTKTWTKSGAWSLSNPPDGGSGKIVIPKDMVWTLYREFKFNGTLEVHGTIIFYQENSNGGVLTMDDASIIKIAKDGSLVSSGPGNSGGNKNVISIGTASIKGDKITSAGVGPNELNKSSLEAGGCRVTGCDYTQLPVNLLYFKAAAQANAVEVNWASSKAWDFSHYELERSVDGKHFEYISTIDAEENTNGVVEYSYSDRQPISGTSYYRLKAVDIDGAFEYKEVALVKFGAEIFKVFPNPSSLGYLNISWSHATEGAVVSLKDNMGRSVRATKLGGGNTTISTEGLTPGMYLLSVQGAAGIQQTQVLVQ